MVEEIINPSPQTVATLFFICINWRNQILKDAMIFNQPGLILLSRMLLLLASFAFFTSCQNSKPASSEAKLLFENVIPQPVSATLEGKTFELTKETKIITDEASQPVGMYLADKLNPATGFGLSVAVAKEVPANGIYLAIGNDGSLGDEGYELAISESLIKVTANKPAGLFYGVQTLRQLLPAAIEQTTATQGVWGIATGTIRDNPTYAWRGSMLDVARHFFSVEDVKRYIDLIADYKINILHLHLSDDQGWRIEIKSWPNLTLEGGKTQVGGGKGGFYTQEQYKDIVAYAQSRFITIVPEIDMPGHINSALASYKELNTGFTVKLEPGQKPRPEAGKVYTGIEVGFSTLHIKNPRTFQFVDDVLRELAEITPGPYLHIGGDEAAVTKKEDYIAFVNKFKELVASHGKKIIGWEEVAQGNVDSTVVMQYWHSDKYAQMASEKGAKIILSPSKRVYLDMKYDTATKLGLNWAAYIEVDDSYNWNTQMDGVDEKSVIGIEAPLWSETIATMDDIEFLLFPRLPGIAEVAWTPVAQRNWDTYKIRLGNHAARLKAKEINYYKSPKVNWVE
jgi:hexosaminidase